MRWFAAIGLCVTWVALGHANPAVATGVPFSTEQLDAALALRGAVVPDLAVRQAQPGWVEVRVAGQHRLVRIGELRGAEAARRVALMSMDLDDPALVSASAPAVGLARVLAPRAVARPWRLGASGVVLRDGGGGSVLVERALGPVAARLELGVGARRPGAGVSLWQLPLRAGLVARVGDAVVGELGAALVVVPQQLAVVDGAASRGHGAIEWGGGLELGVGTRLGPVRATVRLGVDLMASATDYRLGGVSIYQSERLAGWLGLGLSRALGAP